MSVYLASGGDPPTDADGVLAARLVPLSPVAAKVLMGLPVLRTILGSHRGLSRGDVCGIYSLRGSGCGSEPVWKTLGSTTFVTALLRVR